MNKLMIERERKREALRGTDSEGRALLSSKRTLLRVSRFVQNAL